VLEALIKELAASKDEELAKMIQPPIQKQLAWMGNRPSQSKENILKEGDEKDEKLKKSAPEIDWLSEATRTTPVVLNQ
jgi:hypothetical protein